MILVACGVLQVVVALSVFSSQGWALTAGLILAVLNILWQIMFLGAYPLWSLSIMVVDALLTTLAIFVAVLWIWTVIAVLMDLFRDPDESGGKKALWALFILFLPFLAVFIYLIVRGNGMRQRAIQQQVETQQAANA